MIGWYIWLVFLTVTGIGSYHLDGRKCFGTHFVFGVTVGLLALLAGHLLPIS